MGNLASIGYGVGKYLTDADQDAVGANINTINIIIQIIYENI